MLLKRPENGVYYFREVVPDDLRAEIGKTEIRTSLGIKVESEALPKHFELQKHWNMQFESLRKKNVVPLTVKQEIVVTPREA